MESTFSRRTWNCEYTSWRGGRREGAPLLFKGYNQSHFWLLNCELWPYIIFFWLFLNTLVAGKVHSLLINILFITAPRAVFIMKMFFFLCWPFWTLGNKEYEKRSCGLLSFLLRNTAPSAAFEHGFLTCQHTSQTRKVFIVPSDTFWKSPLYNHSSNYGLSARTQLEESMTGLSPFTFPPPLHPPSSC